MLQKSAHVDGFVYLCKLHGSISWTEDGVLRRLPTLPKQHALVFGNSVNLPTTFRVRSADPLPASDDAKIVERFLTIVAIELTPSRT